MVAALRGVALVWAILLGGPGALAHSLGAAPALLASFAVATAVAASGRASAGKAVRLEAALAGLVAGFASQPAWIAAIAALGLCLGLAPRSPTPEGVTEPALWIAVGILAPLFEELLYRERLLPALRTRLGSPLAIALSSALFALPHLEPWSVLGTFLVGLMLGAVYLGSGSIELCVGLHAGLNLACLLCGATSLEGARG